ncbi:MAG: DUF5011 domain-containing protein [Lactobacillales bacterium]|jgi:hypothetical protein|nr:DUF5011 domain-containing protein [Lactobacillales bacterium]
MKKILITLAAVIGFIALAPHVRADDITVYADIEKTSIASLYPTSESPSFVAKPIELKIPEGTSAINALNYLYKIVYPDVAEPLKLLYGGGYVSGFYDPTYTRNPDYPSGRWLYPGYLSERDDGSGWMFSVNNVVPTVGGASYQLHDGDILRWQYAPSGAGIGRPFAVNRDALIVAVAKAVNKPDYEAPAKAALDILAKPNNEATQDEVDAALANLDIPVLTGGNDAHVNQGSQFNPFEGINARDLNDGDLSDKIQITGEIDTRRLGSYRLTYTVTNSRGASAQLNRNIQVQLAPTPRATWQSSLADLLGVVKTNPTTDWSVFALACSGFENKDLYDNYLKNLDPKLNQPTDYARTVLLLSSLGCDAHNFKNQDLVTPLLNEKWVEEQGINAVIFAILALNSHDYANTQKYVNYLIDHQNPDGGWSLFGLESDVDITAMALQALAKSNNQPEIDKAVAFLANAQKVDGGFESWGTENVESATQVVIALTALGINNETLQKAIENIKTFQLFDGSFTHDKISLTSNAMSSEQVLCGLVAYDRYVNAKPAFYDFRDAFRNPAPVVAPAPAQKPVASPVVTPAAVITVKIARNNPTVKFSNNIPTTRKLPNTGTQTTPAASGIPVANPLIEVEKIAQTVKKAVQHAAEVATGNNMILQSELLALAGLIAALSLLYRRKIKI